MIKGRKPRQNQSDIEHIQNFFKYSPPLCVAGLEATKSKGTRPPAFFDRHLDERLLLKRVVYLPSLATDLKAVADQSLKAHLLARTLPSTSEPSFPDLEKVKNTLRASKHLDTIEDEADVQKAYGLNMTGHCLIVASTLHFQLPAWSTGYLTWTKKHRRLPGEKYAIADGFLSLAVPQDRPSWFQTSPLHSRIISEEMPLGIWEFKNMSAGSLSVFEAIRDLANEEEFPWEGCDSGILCALEHQTRSDKVLRTWAKLGYNAENMVCGSVASKLKDRPPLPSSKIAKEDRKHARHIMQQTWAEMVNNDVTFGCLNAGSYQIYLHRDRVTQTAFITDILPIDTPHCFKMLTGFLIAILRDAEDRFRLLWKSKPETWSKIHPFENPDIVTKLPRKEILEEASKRAWAVMSPVPAGKTVKLLASSTFVPDSPYERITVKDLKKSTMSTKRSFNGDPFLRIRIPVQEHAARGTLWVSGNEFSGIPNTTSSTVLVKHANGTTQLKALRREFQVLHELRAAGVLCVPIPIGLFRHASNSGSDIKLSYASLVLEDVGKLSIAAHKRALSPDLIEECLRALRQIHKVGYCLRDISPADIIIRAKEFQRDDRPKVSIVGHSLSRAYIPENSWVMDEELQFLLDLLRNPLKRRVREWDDPETDEDRRPRKQRASDIDRRNKSTPKD